MAGLLLATGTPGDKNGHRVMFPSGLSIFCIASLAADLSPNSRYLIASRGLLAAGADRINRVMNTLKDPAIIEAAGEAFDNAYWLIHLGIAAVSAVTAVILLPSYFAEVLIYRSLPIDRGVSPFKDTNRVP